MPVSEISKGVFIIAPRDLPKYKDTAAGQYTSVFTKQRADQWEMAQKQAMLNVELGTKRYAEEMKTYRDRLDALDARKKELAGLKVRVAEGRLDAKDAAELAALREAGDRQKTMAVNAAKKVERMSLSAGGESVTDTTRTGGDGGTKPAKPTTDVSSGAMTGIAKFELITRDPTGTGAEPWLDDKLTKLVNATSSSGGTIVTESAEDRVNARGSVVDRLVAGREADLRRQDPKLTEPQARAQAEKYVLDRLGAIDPAAKAEVKSYFDKVYDIQLGTPDAGGGTSTSRTVTTRPGATTTRKFPGLGDVPDAPTVAAPTVAPDKELQESIDQYIKDLDTAQAGIPRPSLGGTDFITDSRDIMRGRFGGFSGAPEALPFQQRNAAAVLVSNQAYGLSQIEAYRDFLAQQRAEAATAARLRESMAEGPATTSVEALRGAPAAQADQAAQVELTRAAATDLLQARRPSMFDGLVAPATPQIPERAALNIPVRPALTEPPAAAPVPTEAAPPITPPLPAPSVSEAGPVAQEVIRPEAADLMTPAELADYYERLRASADARQFRKELSAMDMGGSEINPDFRRPLSPPASLPRPALPTMAAPQQVAAPFDPQFAVPRTPAGLRPSLGTKEEGQLVVASPAMAPSTIDAAPRGPADISAAVRPAGPLAGQFPTELKAKTERFAKSTEMAEDVRKATKVGLQPTAFGIKKGGPPSTVGYFQNRAEAALELKDKRNKLDRLSGSGPGKVAKELWGQNAQRGVPFENTWQEIQLTFAGDQKSLELAHEVALAYDLIAKEDKAPLKQAPK